MRPHGTRDRAPIPSEPDPARGSPALGAGGVWVAAAAAAAGIGSAYWDDSWHTTLGRDSTFIPPAPAAVCVDPHRRGRDRRVGVAAAGRRVPHSRVRPRGRRGGRDRGGRARRRVLAHRVRA